MNTKNDFQKHLDNCWRCRNNPNDMCSTGMMLFVHELVKDLQKEEEFDFSYCDDCDVINNPKCDKCIGA
jgi:hypothetical protein